MSFLDILKEELALETWQFEERSGTCISEALDQKYLEVDCLVNEDWLKAAASSDQPLPRCTPPFSQDEVHWMLQPSCASIPGHPWHRIHICCFRKPGEARLKHHCRRFLVPQSVPNIDNIHAFLTAVAHETTLASWRDFERRLDETNREKKRNKMERQKLSTAGLTPPFMSQLVKVIYNKTMRPLVPNTEENTPNQPVPSLSSLSDPSLILNSTQPKASGRENLSPLKAALESSSAYYLIYEYQRFTLLDCILHSPAMFEGSARPLFVVYQLLKLLSYCHSKGLTLGGGLNLNSSYVDNRLWIQYYLPPTALAAHLSPPPLLEQEEVCSGNSSPTKHDPERFPPTGSVPNETQPISKEKKENGEDYSFPSLSLIDSVTKWRSGELSNFDYLMLLNYHAGRRLGDPNNHPIFPWVTDFTHKNGNLRNLSCSKHRLTKGDTQLDFTYSSANEMYRRSGTTIGNVVPHHIGDIASDVTYYVYKARQTTKDVLCSRVRPHWVPEQYPVSIEKMYDWTPDECIPEFYTSPDIFYSIHPDLPDLQVPEWCSNPEEFIHIHRNLLESDPVSTNLHHWIDLTFGFRLSGDAAVKAKNVYLSLVDGHTHPCSSGIVQLFRSAHPKRLQNSPAPVVISQWQRYLATSSLTNLTTFDIPQISKQQGCPGNASSEDERKSFIALLHEQQYTRSPDIRGNRSGIDDGSFEHVPYPQDLEDQMLVDMTPDASLYPANSFYETGMLNKQNRGPVGKQALDVVNPNDQAVKQGLLRGILRPKRPQAGDTGNETFDWQWTGINFPQESHPLQPLTQLEELSHFLNKSCNGYGQMFERTWHPDDLLMLGQNETDNSLSQKILELLQSQEEGCCLSHEHCVLLDITAVACVAMEITASKSLRASLPVQGSLSDRYSSIRRLICNGRLTAPDCLRSLIQLIFTDKPDPSLRPLDIFPHLSSSFLIQQFIPVLSFPTYFDTLYDNLSELQTRSLSVGLSLAPVKPHLHNFIVSTDKEDVNISEVIGFMSDCCNSLLPLLDTEGRDLLMLYILPLFEHPKTSFEAATTLFEPVSSFLGSKWVQQSLILPFLNLFDSFSQPGHRYSLLGRSMAEKLITHFSLSVFLSRFLNCYIEAVIEPMGHRMKQQTHLLKQTFKDQFLKGAEDSGRSLHHKVNLTHMSTILSPSSTTSGRQSVNFNTWPSPHDVHSDEEDSDVEGDLSFPDVSLFEAKLPSIFGMSDDMEQKELATQPDSSNISDSGAGDTKEPLDRRDSADLSFNKESGTVSTKKSPLPQQQSVHKEPDEPTEVLLGITPLPVVVSTPPKTLPILPPTSITSFSMPPPSVQSTAMSTNGEPLLPPTSMESSLPLLPIMNPMVLPSESPPHEAPTDELEERDPQEEQENEAAVEGSIDPQVVAISQHISEAASDCLIWLLWRLGPILATKYIAHPLLDNLHRCFSGVHYKSRHHQGGVRSVLEVMASFVQYYGEQTITHFFLPFIKQQVSNLIKRTIITVKAESGLASSITILELVINKTQSCETLLGLMEDLSLSYFQPLFILLCSRRHVFPSGSEARITICNSAVKLMRTACDKLGSSRSSEVLMEALKCFFNCYSTVHGSSNALVPVEGHFGQDGSESPHDRVEGPETLNPTAVEQVLETFSASLVHETYVHFCKLIGQIQLRKHLQDNIDMIEDLHASYSQKKIAQGSTDCLPSLVGLMEEKLTDSTSSLSSSGSSDGSQSNLDLTYQLGPFQAFRGKNGLGRDSCGFGDPSWFVEVERNETDSSSGTTSSQNLGPIPLHAVGRLSGIKTVHQQGGGMKTQSEGLGGIVQTQNTALEVQSGMLDRGSALFEAKFRPVAGELSNDSALTEGRKDEDFQEAGCTLSGEWVKHWSYQACQANTFRSYDQFEGRKLQTYSGHKSSIKSICVLDSEHLFVSGSKDKTVKIWSLHNHGGGSSLLPPRLTYLHHQKPIVKIDVINSHQNVLSCDGSLHLWDIETGFCIQQFTPSRPTIQFLAVDPLPDSPSQVLVATSDLHLKFIDIRAKKFQHSWRTFFPTGGSIRFLSSHGTWTAAGNVNGSINVLDLRTGDLTANWKMTLQQSGWGENLVHLRTTPRGNILTSTGAAGLVSLWKPNGKALNHFKGHNASIPCLEIFGEQLVTVSSNGNVMVHGSFEYLRDNVVSNCRLKMRGNVSCSAALLLNELLLLGSDYGQIMLMA